LALRLRDDFRARGHDVWFDEERLKPGHDSSRRGWNTSPPTRLAPPSSSYPAARRASFGQTISWASPSSFAPRPAR
jgi:hypothetical protein